LSDFNENWIFLDRFLKKYSNIKFYKSPTSGGAELFHADGQDRHDEANSRFSQFFAEVPKNWEELGWGGGGGWGGDLQTNV